MVCNSYGRMNGVKVFSRRFFYFLAVLCFVTVLICMLCACDDDGSNTESGMNTIDEVTFVLNNGDFDVVCTKNQAIPTPTKDGQYLAGWCLDETLNNALNFESLDQLFDYINSESYDGTDCKLYAKWETLKNMSNVQIKSHTFIYDGTKQHPILENLPTNAEVEYISDGDCINVGTYPIIAVIKAYGYNTYKLSCSLTINKARIDMSKVTFEDKTVVWSGDPNSIFISGELPNGVSVSYENNGQASVGKYDVIARFEVGANYEAIADMSATLTVKPKTYKVTFVEENGDSKVCEVEHGANLLDYAAPKAKRGYVGSWSALDFDSIDNNATVHAEYSLEEYDISYELNGGIFEGEYNNKYTINERVVLPVPKREHFHFVGWFSDEQCESKAETEISVDSIGNKKFYAKWTPKDYTVSFELRGGVNNEFNTNFDDVYLYNILSKNLVLSNPSKKGYEFLCWENSDGDKITEISAQNPQNITVYAKWKVINHFVSYELNGGTVLDELIKVYNIEDDDIVMPTPIKRGYDFCGWYDNAEFGGDAMTKIETSLEDRNITLYAKWEIKVFTIDFALSGGAFSDEIKCTFTLNDDEFELPKPSRKGYSFDGWFEDMLFSGDEVSSVNPDEKLMNINLYAKWTVIAYKITYIMDEGENNSSNPTEYTIVDENITLAQPTKQGYEFKGWYSNPDFAGSEVHTVFTSFCYDVVLYAKWEYIVWEFVLENINGRNIITSYNYALGFDITIPLTIDGILVDGVKSEVLSRALSVVFETNWTKIDDDIFKNCTSLQTLVLPRTLDKMPDGFLSDCIALKNLTVPFVGLTKFDGSDGEYYPLCMLFGRDNSYGDEYCYQVEARQVSVREGNVSVNHENYTYRYVPNSLRNITVLGGNVADYALSGLISVTNFVFENDVCTFGTCAMQGCYNLTDINFSQMTSYITPNALLQCISLERVSAYRSIQENLEAALKRAYSDEVIKSFVIVWQDEL